MELNTTATSGADSASGAAGDNKENANSTSGEGASSAFEKVLKEKKNAMERIKQLEAEKKARDEQEMVKKEEYKELLKARDEELAKERTLRLEFEKKEKTRRVETALVNELDKLGLDPAHRAKALKLANMERLQVDEDTGVVVGAVELAKSFYQENSTLGFFTKKQPGANHNAPSINMPSTPEEAFASEMRAAKTQSQIDAVLKKYNK
jgi:hypothetical protein